MQLTCKLTPLVFSTGLQLSLCEPMPTLKETYHQGTALDLYASQLLAPPTNTDRVYKDGRPIPTQLSERYNKSIAERVVPPSIPPAVSITLEKRFDSSMCRVPHVWTARVQGSSLDAGVTTTMMTTIHTTYPPQLVAKIYDSVFFIEYAILFLLDYTCNTNRMDVIATENAR